MFYWDIIWGSNLEFGLEKLPARGQFFGKNIGDERFFEIVDKISEIEKS